MYPKSRVLHLNCIKILLFCDFFAHWTHTKVPEAANLASCSFGGFVKLYVAHLQCNSSYLASPWTRPSFSLTLFARDFCQIATPKFTAEEEDVIFPLCLRRLCVFLRAVRCLPIASRHAHFQVTRWRPGVSTSLCHTSAVRSRLNTCCVPEKRLLMCDAKTNCSNRAVSHSSEIFFALFFFLKLLFYIIHFSAC